MGRVMTHSVPAAFFSYCRADSGFALKLARDMRNEGATVWLDQIDIMLGQPFDRAIEAALKNCSSMIVILSPAAVESTNVMEEVSFALEEKKTVIPVIYKDCLIPLKLRDLHFVDLMQDYARGLKDLLQTLAAAQNAAQSLPFEAYLGDRPYVFVSYSHEDERKVFPELRALHENGIRIWYDEGIGVGSEWSDNIGRALDRASLFLVFVTTSAVESQNLRNEINFALDRRKPFLAVHLEETTLPVGLRLRMGGIQGILKWRMTREQYAKKIASCFPPTVIAE